MLRMIAILVLLAPAALAQTLVPTRTLRAGAPITEGDVALIAAAPPPGAATDPFEALGLEARATLYAGRPIPIAALGPPALVDRNALVTLVFLRAGLEIRTDGRSLARGGAGDLVRVMNLGSRSIVTGRVAGPGLVHVHP